MRLARLYQKLHCEPLMLSDVAFASFDRVLQSHLSAAGPLAGPAVRPIDPAGADATLGDSIEYYRRARATGEQIRVEEVLRKYGPVAVVQVHGAIDRNLSRMEVECYGACDLQDVNAALDELAADATIQTVIIDFDTPGGGVTGLAETYARILKLRQTKNVVATVFGECHSAGVYLAVACEYILIGAGAWMGNIGVRCARLDMTKAMEKQGISVTNFASSDEKSDFSPAKPLTPEEAARIQARVTTLYADFCARVRAGRPGMDEQFFRAQIFYGQEAIDAGLADELADSLDAVASDFLATAAVYASNAGGGGLPFSATPAPQARGENPFQASHGGWHRDNKGQFAAADTGDGSGGSSSRSKRTPAPSEPSERSKRAKAAYKPTGKDIQRYSEEHNEAHFASEIGGKHITGNGPIDVEFTGADGKRHGIELKTITSGTRDRIDIKTPAQKRKAKWERDNKGQVHVVVLDDRKVYNAHGEGQHDFGKREIYYRRGYASFRLDSMHKVSSVAEIKKLIDTPSKQLPPLAKKR